MKEGVLENFAKFTGKHIWFAKFSKARFLQNTSGRLLLAFSCNITKMGYCQQCWKTSDEYSLSRNTNLRSTVQVYHFFFQQDKLSVCVFIGLHCLLPEAVIRVEVFCKKGVLKDFVNFIGKHLCLSLFLNKVAGLTPILNNIGERLLLHCTHTTHCYLSVLLYIQHILPHHHCYYC